jgi:hypothetical protein
MPVGGSVLGSAEAFQDMTVEVIVSNWPAGRFMAAHL